MAEPLHRGKETDGLQSGVERSRDVLGGVVARRVDHEEADESGWMTGDRARHRRRIVGEARDERRARNLLGIQFGLPSIGERIERFGIVPTEAGEHVGR